MSLSVFDPEGPMYLPMANPEDPATRLEDDEDVVLEAGADNPDRNEGL
jgi:hypothetical protein